MRSQSFKLSAIGFVLGLVAIFGAGSAAAQTKLTFETSFDFQVGREKLSAGKYELVKMSYGKYLLKNAATKQAQIVVFDLSSRNSESEPAQRIIFNRYSETYFLRAVFEKRGVDGQQSIESKYENRVRKGLTTRESQLAGDRPQPQKVTVPLANE